MSCPQIVGSELRFLQDLVSILNLSRFFQNLVEIVAQKSYKILQGSCLNLDWELRLDLTKKLDKNPVILPRHW